MTRKGLSPKVSAESEWKSCSASGATGAAGGDDEGVASVEGQHPKH